VRNKDEQYEIRRNSYSLTEQDGEMIIKVAYTLHDGSGQDEL